MSGDVEGRVEVFGIRHHGPGSTRSLLTALADFAPDVVLIEGPADADPMLHWAARAQMTPPLALLGYVAAEPQKAAFWPYAVFSPEWQSLRWALSRGIDVGYCDLPAAITLATQPETLVDDIPASDGAGPVRSTRHDPLGALAEAAGYDDPERWWEDVMELRSGAEASPFPLVTEAMAELRRVMGQPSAAEAVRESRREAYMRQTIRAALKRGRQRVAVVCGAWHAPALTAPLGPAAADTRILRGLARTKVVLTWVPWTHERLASASGYGAGISSPGWYHHLWTAREQPVVRWLTKVAHVLRERDLPVSSAHVIEAVRLAETLAALRLRPLAGLAEVTEATRSVLCDGDEVAVRFITDQLVVGQQLGSVDPGVPTVPLEADLSATGRRLRLRREPQPRLLDLDLRKPIDQARSQLFHRLQLLDLRWAVPTTTSVVNQGTFRESWQLAWAPEFSVAVVAAAVWGTTVATAATARVAATTATGTLVELTTAVERCLLADLPDALSALLRSLENQAALDVDVVHLMDALPALARARRYGDVRQTDTTALGRVSEVLVVRICAGLPQAVAGLDDESATAVRQRIMAVNSAIGLLGSTSAQDRWWATLASVVDRTDLHGLLLGRVVRLLVDAERLGDGAVRVERALSVGVPAAAKAAWVDGFFADGALLLIHDRVLRELLDTWVAELDETEFVDLLPLVRRTFATFTPAERRSIAEQVARRGDAGEPGRPAADEIDPVRAGVALQTVDLILAGRR
jgi:hypothetical protein